MIYVLGNQLTNGAFQTLPTSLFLYQDFPTLPFDVQASTVNTTNWFYFIH